MATVVLVGTLDTKGVEYEYLRERLREHGVDVVLVDGGVLGEPRAKADVSREEVARAAGADARSLADAGDRGAAVETMARGAAEVVTALHTKGRLDGVLALGGSGGTALATEAMRALPVGVPKLMVSTMASGDTRPYVGESDVTMMYSVVDISGINAVSARILTNAAAAMAGMASAEPPAAADGRPLVGATMFGVTTPCVEAARERLEGLGYEVLVFHATGTGGRSMEALMRGGFITASLDITTTELADDLVGGVLSAGPDRLEAAGELGIPQVVSLGALDMVNFGPMETVPAEFRDRLLYKHNPTVTLMRTTAEECAELGRRIGRKLSAATGPTTLFIPLQGTSLIDVEGQVFHDPDADRALFDALRESLDSSVDVRELDTDVNDPEFANAMANTLHEQYQAQRRPPSPDRENPGRVEGKPPPWTEDVGGWRTGNAGPVCPGRPGAPREGGDDQLNREEALSRLWAQVEQGRPIIGAGAGTGLSAKCAEAGGADLIIIYNSGRYRMAGRGSLAGLLPYGDANAIVVEMAAEVLPIVKSTPVLAGVCGTDPFRLMAVFLRQIEEIGFTGVQNFPTVGLFDGTFRQNLEETGMGYDLEVEMIRAAHELGLLTCPYVFTPEDARAMAEAGADVIVPHMGLTTSGTIGAQTARTLDESVELVQAMHDAAVRAAPDVLVLCHGGPIAEPGDAAYVLERTSGVVGFFGASSMERLPTEVAMTENMKRFKSISVGGKEGASA